MFGLKEIKQAISEFKSIKESCNKIIDDYFKGKKKSNLNYETDDVAGKFYELVQSIDNRFKDLESKIDGFTQKQEEDKANIAALNQKNEALQEEINADNDELASKDEKIDELNAIIQDQEKQLAEKKAVKARNKK